MVCPRCSSDTFIHDSTWELRSTKELWFHFWGDCNACDWHVDYEHEAWLPTPLPARVKEVAYSRVPLYLVGERVTSWLFVGVGTVVRSEMINERIRVTTPSGMDMEVYPTSLARWREADGWTL